MEKRYLHREVNDRFTLAFFFLFLFFAKNILPNPTTNNGWSVGQNSCHRQSITLLCLNVFCVHQHCRQAPEPRHHPTTMGHCKYFPFASISFLYNYKLKKEFFQYYFQEGEKREFCNRNPKGILLWETS